MALLPIRLWSSTTMWATVYTCHGNTHLNKQLRNLNNDIQVPFMHCYGCSGGHLSIIKTASYMVIRWNSVQWLSSLTDSAITNMHAIIILYMRAFTTAWWHWQSTPRGTRWGIQEVQVLLRSDCYSARRVCCYKQWRGAVCWLATYGHNNYAMLWQRLSWADLKVVSITWNLNSTNTDFYTSKGQRYMKTLHQN